LSLDTQRAGYAGGVRNRVKAEVFAELSDPVLFPRRARSLETDGDVRSESTKRVAGAVGDGALVVRFAHEVLGG